MKEIKIQRAWLERLLEYVKVTQEFMDKDLDYIDRKVLLDAHIPELVGYCLSAKTIFKYNKK